MDEWAVAYEGFVPEEEGLREALCTLGNGNFATRGAMPESSADGVHYPGTYIAGCYNRLSTDIAGHTIENEDLVNAPNWLVLSVAVEDGPWLDMDEVKVLRYRQELDMRRAVLTRHLRFRDGAGRTTRLTQRRIVHMGQAHVAALETTVVPEDWSGTLRVRSGLDGTVQNTGVSRYRQLASQHLEPITTRQLDDESVLLVVQTAQSHIRIAEAARTQVFRRHPYEETAEQIDVARDLVREPAWIGQEMSFDISADEQVTIEKVVTLYSSRDRAISEPEIAASEHIADLASFDGLLESHALVWKQLWERFAFDFTGQSEFDPLLRLHLLHLLQTVSLNTIDLDVGVPPRGLHGEAYRGHVFWDEVFVFPILNLRLPEVTRALMRYRYRRLDAARRAAHQAGYSGAMYPWQSGSDGREESQRLHLNPMSGRWIPDPTHLQRHIGLAVAYNIWTYYQATGDIETMAHYGAEMLLEIARFWASLATYDHGLDRYVIRKVVGPDEFHTGYPLSKEPGIDNNAYTNLMAVWVLLRALETQEFLPAQRRAELGQILGLHADELTRWEDITRRMYVPFHGDGIISQFEGYDDLEDLDWAQYQAAYGDIHRLDRILEKEGRDPNSYKISKQADVLMLFYLLSSEELLGLLNRLGYASDPSLIPRTIEYYMPRTSHGSTLSAVVHAWVLARSDREGAVDFFTAAMKSDFTDVQGGTTAEGIHLAAMTGSVDLLQRCFAGIETRGDTLWLDPLWPPHLGVLKFGIRYRGQPVTLQVSGRSVSVTTGTDINSPIRIGYRSVGRELGPGQTIEFTL